MTETEQRRKERKKERAKAFDLTDGRTFSFFFASYCSAGWTKKPQTPFELSTKTTDTTESPPDTKGHEEERSKKSKRLDLT